ncbi:WXG100 family type VII secretion target [Kitasatospora mediocidica]|uniref:WXG100 family type VII secretion target n=1 Tax=Kitasatospora mediocidica TaxID=58352 RepID=UPI0018DE60C7|nr:WXG100 family type VII secretion target [Kitasatospora mediocidica]
MAQAMNSGDVMSASDPWRRAAATLKQIRTALDTASGDATDTWDGSTSDAFYAKMTKLASSVNNTAAYANDTANTLQMMSEAIDEAKREMPEEPGFLAQVGNAISDTAQSAVGIDDDSTQIPIAERKKAEAVAVMQALANKYRTATPVLKPPPIQGPVDVDEVPPPDPTAAAAASSFVMGAGLGAIGGYATSVQKPSTPASRTTVPAVESPRTSSARSAAPTDAGIQGGVANPAPRPVKSVGIGAELPPVSGQQPSDAGTTGGGAGTSLANTGSLAVKPLPTAGTPASGGGAAVTGGGSGAMPMGFGGGLVGRASGATPAKCEPIDGGLVGEEVGPAGSGRAGGSRAGGAGAVFDPEGAPAAGAARPADSGARVRAGGAARQAQGAIGEAEGAESAGGGRQKAFTEGGTGLGARGRAPVEVEGAGTERPEFLPGNAQELKRKKRREGKRAEYLVEDEETWLPDQGVNPTVVE